LCEFPAHTKKTVVEDSVLMLPPRVSHTVSIHCSSEIQQFWKDVSLQCSVTETAASDALHAAHKLFCLVLRTLYFSGHNCKSASVRVHSFVPRLNLVHFNVWR